MIVEFCQLNTRARYLNSLYTSSKLWFKVLQWISSDYSHFGQFWLIRAIPEAKKYFASIIFLKCISNIKWSRKNIKRIKWKTKFHAIRGTQNPRFLVVCPSHTDYHWLSSIFLTSLNLKQICFGLMFLVIISQRFLCKLVFHCKHQSGFFVSFPFSMQYDYKIPRSSLFVQKPLWCLHSLSFYTVVLTPLDRHIANQWDSILLWYFILTELYYVVPMRNLIPITYELDNSLSFTLYKKWNT